MTGRGPRPGNWMRCPHCGKRGYYSRKAAKKAMREIHSNDHRMRPYPCEGGTTLWHFGHLPDIVKTRGLQSADVVFDDRASRRHLTAEERAELVAQAAAARAEEET